MKWSLILAVTSWSETRCRCTLHMGWLRRAKSVLHLMQWKPCLVYDQHHHYHPRLNFNPDFQLCCRQRTRTAGHRQRKTQRQEVLLYMFLSPRVWFFLMVQWGVRRQSFWTSSFIPTATAQRTRSSSRIITKAPRMTKARSIRSSRFHGGKGLLLGGKILRIFFFAQWMID